MATLTSSPNVTIVLLKIPTLFSVNARPYCYSVITVFLPFCDVTVHFFRWPQNRAEFAPVGVPVGPTAALPLASLGVHSDRASSCPRLRDFRAASSDAFHHTLSPPHDHDLNPIAERIIGAIAGKPLRCEWPRTCVSTS